MSVQMTQVFRYRIQQHEDACTYVSAWQSEAVELLPHMIIVKEWCTFEDWNTTYFQREILNVNDVIIEAVDMVNEIIARGEQ